MATAAGHLHRPLLERVRMLFWDDVATASSLHAGQVRGREARHIPTCIDVSPAGCRAAVLPVTACTCTYVLNRSIAQSTIT
jgi:hypothetical protein